MEITYIPISKLKPKERNPRKIIGEQFEKLCQNIKNDPEFLAMRPLLVNKTEEGMIVYAGNQRLQALKKLKKKEAPCIVLENVPQETIKKRVILDNLHHGEHDFDLLSSLYEVDELLDLGMLEKELGMAVGDIEDMEGKPEKKKKLKMCPQCGCEF
jgi:ParB-like chromosome segregation protein Spo0J